MEKDMEKDIYTVFSCFRFIKSDFGGFCSLPSVWKTA